MGEEMARPVNPLNDKDYLIKELNSMLEELREDQKRFDDSNRKDMYWILYFKNLFDDRPYTSSKFNYEVEKFSETVPEIREKIKKIKEIIVSRVVWCATSGRIGSQFAQFWMKNQTLWRDVVETKGEVIHEYKVDMPPKANSMTDWEKGIKEIYEESKSKE